MGKRQSDITKLDLTIAALEHLILATPEEEVLAHGSQDVHHTREIIDNSINECGTLIAQSLNSKQRNLSRPKKNRSQMLGEWQAKVAFFRNLMATRPDLSPRLSAAFGAGRTPSNDELDDVTNELINQGLILKNGIKKK